MPNPGQPTIGPGATGESVRRAQRALRRTPDLGLEVDGIFGPSTEAAVKNFQHDKGLTVDGIVGPQYLGRPPGRVADAHLAARIDRRGRAQPSAGTDKRRARPVEHDATGRRWRLRAPHEILGGGVPAVGQGHCRWHCQRWHTWSVSLHAMTATLETEVGLKYVIG